MEKPVSKRFGFRNEGIKLLFDRAIVSDCLTDRYNNNLHDNSDGNFINFEYIEKCHVMVAQTMIMLYPLVLLF